MHLQFRFYSTTIIIFLLISSLIAIFFGWINAQETIFSFFHFLSLQQKNLFLWLNFSNVQFSITLFLPLIISILVIQFTLILSPKQKKWSRIIIIFTSLFLMIRYFLWRWKSTLNLNNPVNTIFSIGIFLIELAFIISPFWQSILMLNIKNRKSQADTMSEAVKQGIYYPTVDILIPSYNEPLEVIKRTIVGCQAIEYNYKKIYLLDDGNREEIRQLCEQLKCYYISRENSIHAKAGNLNHALSQTNGELIVVFDADFIPTTNFLTRTVGFFQDIKIGLLQTYQSFYSHDPIARNLGLDDKIPTEVEIFSRYYQLVRDSINTALCYGSSFVIRRQSLEKIGGFVINSLSDDYHTGIKLASENYQVIYMKETLSAGLSAENIFGHIRQRKRWARGTIQTLFIAENPLKLKGLKWWQKLAHLEGIFQWFISPLRLILLLLPLIYIFFQISPIKSSFEETISFFLPFYFVQLLTFSWLNFYSRSALLADIYNVVTAIPISVEIFQTLLNPFLSIFKVTPKGIKNDNYYFNWNLASPLIFILVINLMTLFYLGKEFIMSENNSFGLTIFIFWNVYNLIILLLSIIVMLDIPKLDGYQWLKMRKKIRIITNEYIWEGLTNNICEIGAEISLNSLQIIPPEGKIEFIKEGLLLEFKTVKNYSNNKNIKVIFKDINLLQYRQLIIMIFCPPNRWSYQQTPRELMSFLLLIQSLFVTPLKLIKSKLIKERIHGS